MKKMLCFLLSAVFSATALASCNSGTGDQTTKAEDTIVPVAENTSSHAEATTEPSTIPAEPYIFVNDYAEHDDILHADFYQVSGDGAVFYFNGEYYIYDSGRGNILSNYISSIRKALLTAGGKLESLSDQNYKIKVNLLISHCHSDHVGGLITMLSSNRFVYVDKVYIGTASGNTTLLKKAPSCEADSYRPQLLAVMPKTAEIHYIDFGKSEEFTFGDGKVKVSIKASPVDWGVDDPSTEYGYSFIKEKLAGTTIANMPENTAVNDNSLWFRISYGTQSYLLTGDTFANPNYYNDPTILMMEAWGDEIANTTVLKNPHHGSGRFYPPFTQLTAPKYSVFTSNYSNISQNAVSKLLITATVRYGDIYISGDGAVCFESTESDTTVIGTPAFKKGSTQYVGK